MTTTKTAEFVGVLTCDIIEIWNTGERIFDRAKLTETNKRSLEVERRKMGRILYDLAEREQCDLAILPQALVDAAKEFATPRRTRR